MNSLDLPWLPLPHADFVQQLRSLRDSEAFDAVRFRKLATTRLNLQQLTALSRALPSTTQGLPGERLKLRVLCNGTFDFLLPAVLATAPRHGLSLVATNAPFGSHVHEALDPASETNRGGYDVSLLMLDHRAFEFSPCPGDVDIARQAVDTAVAHLNTLTAALQKTSSRIVVQTLAPPPGALFGSLDASLPGTLAWQIHEFNRLVRAQRVPGRLVLDVAAIAASVGTERWHDPTIWALAKIPIAQQAIPLYADHVCRLLMAASGKSRKCLVLDLDNTCWGGVIGDDGMAGIIIGQGNPRGEAFLNVQATALALRGRGIMLAVCSKNDDAAARMPFREHPEMLLKEQHIAAFQANWEDKPANLRAIAKALNIGIDALVLLDDNPVERDLVRETLPEVGVPELPEDPGLFAPTLLAAGFFEAIDFNDDDRQRADQYQTNALRSALLESTTDLDTYLASLKMVAYASPFDEVGRGRITQLINKTNQFNLTTRRRSEAEIAGLEQDPHALTLQVRLKDRFGDNGVISVIICVVDGDAWRIDTWLMSCRVLNRGVEHAVLNLLVELADQRGIARLIGCYVPSERNSLVKQHYPSLGFVAPPGGRRGSEWTLRVSDYRPKQTHIEIHTAVEMQH